MGDPGGGSQAGGGLSASVFNELVQRMSRRVLEAGQQLKEVLESKPLSSVTDQQILELLQQTSSESSPSSSQGPGRAPLASSIKQENSIPKGRASASAFVKLEEEDVITLSDTEDEDDQMHLRSSMPVRKRITSRNQTIRICNDSIKIENDETHRSLLGVSRASRNSETGEEHRTNVRTRKTVKLEREENHPQIKSEHADEVQFPLGNRKDAESRRPRTALRVPKIEKEEDVSTSALPNAFEDFMNDNERQMSQKSFQDVIEVSSSSDDEEERKYRRRRPRRTQKARYRLRSKIKQEVSTAQPSRSSSPEVIMLDDDEPPQGHEISIPWQSESSPGANLDCLWPIRVKSEILTPISTCEFHENVKVEASSPAAVTLEHGKSPGSTKSDDDDDQEEYLAKSLQSSGGVSIHSEVDETETTLLVDSDSSKGQGEEASFSPKNVQPDQDRVTVSNDSVEAQTTATSTLEDKESESTDIEDGNASAVQTSSESNTETAVNDTNEWSPSLAASPVPSENKESDDEDANIATDIVHPEDVDSEDSHDKDDHADNVVIAGEDMDLDDIVFSDDEYDNNKVEKNPGKGTLYFSSDSENSSDFEVHGSRRPSSATQKKDAVETIPSNLKNKDVERDEEGDRPTSDDDDALDKDAASDLESSVSTDEEAEMASVISEPVSMLFRRPIPRCFRSDQSEMEEVERRTKKKKRSRCLSGDDESDEEPVNLKVDSPKRSRTDSNDNVDFDFNFRSPSRSSTVSGFATAGSEAPDHDDILDFGSELYGPTVTRKTKQPNFRRRSRSELPPGTKIEWRDPPAVPRPIQPTRFATKQRRSVPSDSDIRCELCDKPFLTNGGLQGHLKDKICTGGPLTRHGCRKCDIIFTTPYTLDIHMNQVHEGSITWGCRKCLEKFSSPSLRNHHEQNCYQCDNCNGCFYGRERFEKHQRRCDQLMQM